MKVLIMSDSHGLTEEIQQIKARHEGEIEAAIHCGDSELPKDAPEMDSLLAVRGNCDYDAAYPNDLTETIGGRRFFVTHGHHYNVKMTLMNLAYKSEEAEADIVCFGHSHAAGSEMIGKSLFINPGSIRQPRGRIEKTYVILEINGEEAKVTFFDTEGNPVQALSRIYQLS
ncbi:metallophosphoesterase family protein [Bacillus massiliglaciei]|uniref:metallophosphoesterase family protein n=1 Tax=Bacillus massiliglaciei TaxID=1816693 RepID=UPI000ADD2A2C|nr:metallophosphoesterase [Bacillus massiliglaciei]